jgi:hypothetical protein
MNSKSTNGEGFSQTTFNTFAYLFKDACMAHEHGKAVKEGCIYFFLNALVCAAFAVEGYCNHLGEKRIKLWKYLERSSVYDKLNILADDLGFTPQWGGRPYQTLNQLIAFRNTVAHARTEIVTGDSSQLTDLEPDWMSKCEADHVQRVLDDVKEVIEDLQTRANLPKYPLNTMATGASW